MSPGRDGQQVGIVTLTRGARTTWLHAGRFTPEASLLVIQLVSAVQRSFLVPGDCARSRLPKG